MKKKFPLKSFSPKSFDQRINQKSPYLNHLSNQNHSSLKSLQNKKIDILFDEMSGNNKFKRNYSIFDPTSKNNYSNCNISKIDESEIINDDKSLYKNIPVMLPYLKIITTSPNEREFPEKYQKKEFKIDNFSGIYLKPKPISLHKIKQNKIEINSYKISKKKPINLKNSAFFLPLVNRNHFLSSNIKNNEPFFSNNRIKS